MIYICDGTVVYNSLTSMVSAVQIFIEIRHLMTSHVLMATFTKTGSEPHNMPAEYMVYRVIHSSPDPAGRWSDSYPE